MPARELPARPDLEQYKKQAKELVREGREALPDARARLREFHPRPLSGGEPIRLADAQSVIAREHGFASWPSFVRAISENKISQGRVAPQGEILVRVDHTDLAMDICFPQIAAGAVVMATAGACGRLHPRNLYVAKTLCRNGFAALQVDLMTEDEELNDSNQDLARNIGFLGRRLVGITEWLTQQTWWANLSLGYWGSAT